ncbi:MAG: SH3 domain-containing protein [Candidatus Omnitrophica bacterium]|nr:SH3 domain-containing protein [Candidatus Omnitrophota bacterium]
MIHALAGLLFVPLLICVLPDDAGAAQFPFSARPIRDHVRVRADSTLYSPILGELMADAPIRVVAERWDWYKISLPSEIPAYVHSSFLKQISPTLAQVTASGVNARAYASREAPVVGTLSHEDRVEYSVQEGEWIKIKSLPKFSGYVHSQFVVPIPTAGGDLEHPQR